MRRATPILRGYLSLLAAVIVFCAGVVVGHDDAGGAPAAVAQTVPASDQSALLPSDAPVANLITLRSMSPGAQSRFLDRMTDPQLIALQTVAVTTPNVLPQANDEALRRGLPELTAGGTDSFGAVRAVPVDPAPDTLLPPDSPDPDDPSGPNLEPRVGGPCDGCRVVSL